jgi:hypothetical protein
MPVPKRQYSPVPDFMPTSGTYFMAFFNNSEIYQDNVDLSQSTKLLFDYDLGSSWTLSDTVTASMLFISGGATLTLWTKSLPGAMYGTDIQKKNQTINLPSLPHKGRLQIEFKGASLAGLDIDNIRAQ